MSDKIEVNRRRVLGGLVTIGVAGAAVGAGTFAAFSDTEESTDNTIQAGTLSLRSFSGAEFTATNIAPGWDPSPYTVETTYDGDSTVDPVDVDLTIDLNENDTSSSEAGDLNATEFAQKIQVDGATLEDSDTGSNDLTGDLSSRQTGHPDDQSYIDLAQLEGTYEDALTDVSPGDDVTLSLDLSMPFEVGNDAQGEGLDVNVEFVAEQPQP